LYTIQTSGLYFNLISETVYTPYATGSDVSNLEIHHNNSLYSESLDAPSFIFRMEGNLTNSTYGIESLINLQELSDIGVTIFDRSVVDHVYWGSDNPELYGISGMPSLFELDEGHLDFYDVRHLNTS